MCVNRLRKLNKYFKIRFIDSLRLFTKGGTGGSGLPKYGGVGGQGGHVIAEASEEIKDLYHLLQKTKIRKLIAGNGTDSKRNCLLGENGESIILKVPVGIAIYREDGELNTNGSKALITRGGAGGSQDTGFLGLKGQAHTIQLDLKLLADVSSVGFPNAGKSTLLKALSKSKPKIASYPFTTIRPNLGIIEYKDLRQISLADLPGLIEGAHENIGMGHKFLKHVERTKMILMIVDVKGFQLSQKYIYRSCLETIVLLNKELELYKKELLDKPAILAINKMDLDGSQKIYDEIVDNLSSFSEIIKTFPIEMQPNKLIKFDHIQPLIAKDSKHETVSNLKNVIRHYLDLYESLKNEDYKKEEEIIETLRNSITEKAPMLC